MQWHFIGLPNAYLDGTLNATVSGPVVQHKRAIAVKNVLGILNFSALSCAECRFTTSQANHCAQKCVPPIACFSKMVQK
jgi:hypothetical protein